MKQIRNVGWIMVVMFASCLSWKPIIGHAEVLAKFHSISFLTPINKAPENDPFEYKDTANLSGKIAYSPVIAKSTEKYATQYVVIRTLSKGKEVSVLSLPVQTSLSVYDEQFSPDGKSILFKLGFAADPSDTYKICIWNMLTNKINLSGPEDLSFYRVRWSPSGRYIAYCRGGDLDGNPNIAPGDYQPLKLYTFDFSTGKEHFIAKASSARYFTWTKSDKLLFSMTSNQYEETQKESKSHDDTNSSLLNIYQSSPAGEDIKLVVKDGYAPFPSPDGSKLAFVSHEGIDVRQHNKKLELPTDKNALLSYPYLTVYDIKADTFKVINDNSQNVVHLTWLPDNTKVLIARITYRNAKGTLHVNQLNLTSLKQKQVALFEAQDQTPFPRNLSAPQFDNISLSQNAQYYILQSNQVGKLITDKTAYGEVRYYQNLVSIQASGLENAESITICTAPEISHYDWYNLQ